MEPETRIRITKRTHNELMKLKYLKGIKNASETVQYLLEFHDRHSRV